eukprot:scaffold129981_cov33-Tisochrysis_lutea.AAC.2
MDSLRNEGRVRILDHLLTARDSEAVGEPVSVVPHHLAKEAIRSTKGFTVRGAVADNLRPRLLMFCGPSAMELMQQSCHTNSQSPRGARMASEQDSET